MEKDQTEFYVNYTYNINFKGVDLLFDPVSNSKVNNDKKFKIRTTGGVLSDEMGLGKTLIMMYVILSDRTIDRSLYDFIEFDTGKCNYFYKPITLINKDNFKEFKKSFMK